MNEVNNEVINTTDLQQFSVQQFMSKLGYTLYRTQHGGLVFLYNYAGKHEYRMIGMNTAISLHNSGWDKVDGKATFKSASPSIDITADAYTVVQAVSAKVVEKVKLQYSCKKKTLVCGDKSNHFVKFALPEYEFLFIGE